MVRLRLLLVAELQLLRLIVCSTFVAEDVNVMSSLNLSSPSLSLRESLVGRRGRDDDCGDGGEGGEGGWADG